MVALVVVATLVTVAVLVWFFVVRTPEQAARHEPDEGRVSRSTFGPGDAGAEGQAVKGGGEVAPG